MKAEHPTHRRVAHISQGSVYYLSIGNSPTLLFVHGTLVNGEMWREVYPPLSAPFRCIVPILPLGGHEEPVNDANLTSPGVAQLIAKPRATIDLRGVTIVGLLGGHTPQPHPLRPRHEL